ncbi:MAG: PAS domain S-box protein [Betaproteobacteria bacterium]|nr:PAS domain S-box protein [Betaproteobacteria bacterium]
MAGVLALAAWRQRSPWALLLLGMVGFYPVIMLDLLSTNTPLRYALAPIGTVALLVAPAAVLARRFSRALNVEALQDQLALERERLALLVRSTKAGFSDWDAKRDVVKYSERFKEMLGYPPDADSSAWPSIFELMHPEERETMRENFKAMIRRRDAPGLVIDPGQPMEYRLRRADGTYVWVHAEGVAETDADGRTKRFITSFIDITRFREQEEKLRDQLALTSALFDGNPSPVYLKDTQGRYMQVNDAWLKMVGTTRAESIGRTVREIFPEQESERYHAEDMRLLSQGEGTSEVESMRTGPDGKPQWVIVRKAVLRRGDGTVAGLIGTNTDITHLKDIEAQLADRAKFISELVEALPISVAMRDLEGRYVLVNRTWERYFGVKREDALGRRRREFPGWKADASHVADADTIEALDREILERGADGLVEPTSVERLGRHYLITRRVVSDAAGRPTGVLSAGLDVTERRAIEQQLYFERQRLQSVVSATRVGIVDWDGHTHATYYSPRFREILGYAPDADTSGWPDYFKVLIHPEDRERITNRWRAFILGKGPEGKSGEFYSPEEYRLRRQDGSYVWVEVSGIAVRNEKGFVTRWIAATADITERREQEEALRASVRLREEVERMSRHDLKTPLNSVIAMSRMLRESSRLTRDDAELLGTIERAGYRILNMVNLSLDLFRMESGTYQFHPQSIDLAEVARKVAADLESQAASKNVDVRVRANNASAASNPIVAAADELLCYSMLANLTKNAIEAAPEGSTVSLSLRKDEDHVVVDVHNLGAVPEEIRPRFFQKYATSGKSAGLGLGTYSARLMAHVQQGELTLHTSEAEGTTLTVRLKAGEPTAAHVPVADNARATAVAEAREALPALKVLVVDDDEFNRLVLRRTLPTPPLTVTMAVNGRAALEAAEADWPDIVLLDLEMPVMDGYEAARGLRLLERQGRKPLKIVAISSNDEQAIIDKALAAGCDEYLTKPAPRDVLWRILGGVRAFSRESSKTEPSEIKHTSEADAILLDPDLEDTLDGFLATRRAMLGEMPETLAKGDRPAFRRLAHKLAGSFSLYGFGWAAAQCRALERDAPEADLADLERRAAAVRAHLDSVRVRFKEKR